MTMEPEGYKNEVDVSYLGGHAGITDSGMWNGNGTYSDSAPMGGIHNPDPMGIKKRSKEIILTQEQAKTKKLQKGYVLEPVIPPAVDASQPLSAKRERKKSYHFGHGPDEEDDIPLRLIHAEVSTPRAKPKPAPAYAPSPRAAPPVQAMPQLPSEWTEKKKMLQERLRRLNDHIALIRASQPGALPTGPIVPPSRSVTPPVDSTRPGRTPSLWPLYSDASFAAHRGAEGLGGPAKRKPATEVARRPDAKRQRSGGAGGDNRLGPTGRMRNAYLHCSKLLDSLMRDRAAKAYFNMPVDPDALGIPWYRDVVTNPMDLGTVHARLEDGDYESVDAWAADVRLVWSNAMTFNPPGNEVHEFARALAASFDRMMKQFPKIAGAPSSGVPLAGGDGGGRQVLELKRTMQRLEQELSTLKKNKTSSPAPQAQKKPRGGGGGGGGARAMNIKEKRDLGLNINKLDDDQMSKVVDIIRKRNKINVKDTEEVEIDLDSLNNATLRELDKYVSSCLNLAPSSPAAARRPGVTSAPMTSAPATPMDKTHDSTSESDSDDSDPGGLVASGVWDY
mmetsp:Transcript_49014/g.129374  ORF Transcript_49014/g.129374 Transcript_49014/m.129374 type:complete len:562 (+) Transcript_49014:268-1953(+)